MRPRAERPMVPASTGGVQFYTDEARDDRVAPFAFFEPGDEYEPFHDLARSREQFSAPPRGDSSPPGRGRGAETPNPLR